MSTNRTRLQYLLQKARAGKDYVKLTIEGEVQ